MTQRNWHKELGAVRQYTNLVGYQTLNFYSDYNFLPEVLIEGTTNGEDDEVLGLRLPSWELLAYDEEDINLLKSLSEQSNEGHVSTLIQDYILATVTESIKIIERLPSGTPLHEAVQFKRSLVVPSVAFPRLVIHELVCLTLP